MRRRVALIIVTSAAVSWIATIGVAPIAAGGSALLSRSAAACYAAGSLICHQRAERSFHMAGAKLPVCARCTGLYAGAALGALLWVGVAGAGRTTAPRAVPATHATRPRLILIASALPTIVTLVTATLGWWDPGNIMRAMLAIPLGTAVGAAITAVAAGDLR